MAGVEKRQKTVELVFVAVFSVLVFTFFYSIISANGLVLGNDPAVHLFTAQYYLDVGRIPLGDIAWYTPMYHIILDTLIVFTGATTIEQMMTLMKVFTAFVDWLLVFSIYLLSSKFFGKKTGVLAAALIMICFPLIELNSWGGYTTILALAFMMLTALYLALPQKDVGNTLVAFIFAFSVVISHQLATFLAVFILPPFILALMVKSRGKNFKALLAVVLGGAIAFLIYYVRPLLPYLGQLVSIVFFEITLYVYQIPSVSFFEFVINFGFVLFFGFAGLVLAFFKLRRQHSLSFYLLLALAFLVPLLLSQSYLFGIYLPYQRFIYFLLPPLIIFAAVTFSFVLDGAFAAFFNRLAGQKRVMLKAVSLLVVVALVGVMVVQLQTLSGKISEDVEYYSSSDMGAFQVGGFLNENFPDPLDEGVVTEKPGHWLTMFSNKTIITETDPLVDLSYDADCILDLSYEVMHPLTMVKFYTAKTDISDESFLRMNTMWHRVAFSPLSGSYFSYRDPDGALCMFPLSNLTRTVSMDVLHYPPAVTVTYSNDLFVLEQTLQIENNTYPVTTTWSVSALKEDLNYGVLYLSEYFEPTYFFDKVNFPGVLNWSNPVDDPSKQDPGVWAITYFSRDNLTEGACADFYSQPNGTAYALRFADLPDWGIIGALGNGRVDVFHWEYHFLKVTAEPSSVRYQTLTFSMESYPPLADPRDMDSLFTLRTEPFEVVCRNFASIIRDNNVVFIVFDVTRFDPKILCSGWVQLVYQNDKYLVLKIREAHPSANVVGG
ncbi:MAG: hypothetical protein NWF05_06150 [Candidatus Bathyarchaeota archaeon]|nr:hypothetical protein [Candidatus Bathyarchaeota archaeon]